MKILLTIISFIILGFLAGCSTVTEEAGFKEIADFYGGSVFLKKGVNISTTTTEPQGSYLEVALSTPGISKYYNDLQIPASNCAFLVYKHLRPRQRTDYSYFKVSIQDSTTSHTYTFSPADLEFATQSIGNLNELMFSLQGEDFPAITNKLDPAAIGAMSHDSVTANLHRVSQKLAPFSSYLVQGFEVKKAPLAGKLVPIVRFALSVSREQKGMIPLLVFLNPTPHTQRFLCGLRIP
ncbi:hypothetical protein FNT36_05940 [Hymenobacter setariae]|uniref:Lipoprotein n=1 Tax=Hymenobacter setariae TaxID=2594794 RepID=A0A558C4A2_9BACT|nr:hypothetical protein [Hymenobacter setariae]TVT43623.1 hypothetical protein FNT36_05940 [Hymenobacter setariae]